MMTEQEYINVQEKSYLDAAIEILGRIVLANSEVLQYSDFIAVKRELCKWRDEHTKKIKING